MDIKITADQVFTVRMRKAGKNTWAITIPASVRHSLGNDTILTLALVDHKPNLSTATPIAVREPTGM